MMSRLFSLLNRDVTSMNQAAFVLGIFSLLSQVFGLVRDRMLASLVGPSASLDVYYAAFRIPDLIYNSIAVLFSVTVIIPFITKHFYSEDHIKLKTFFDSVFTVYVVGMLSVCTIAFFLMPYLTHLSAPGFDSTQQIALVRFSRFMLLSPFLMGLSSLLGAFAQVQRKFFSFAIAPVFYNFGILLGIIALRPLFGMFGVVCGVILGAIMYFFIQLPTLIVIKKIPSFTKHIQWSSVKDLMKLSLPRTFASSLSNITFLMISAGASMLIAGSLSVFQFAYNIQTTPLMIIGISYAVAAFPTMTRLFAENQLKEFTAIVHRATRNIFFLSVPAAVLLIVLRAHIVRVLLGTGKFSWNDTRLVAASLALFALSITAQCMILLLVRGFYAMGNTKTPLKINIIAVFITAGSAIGLLFVYRYSPLFQDFLQDILRIESTVGANVVLLAGAFSLGQITNAYMLWRRFHTKLTDITTETHTLAKAIFHTISSGILAGAATYGMLLWMSGGVDQGTFWGILLQGIVAGLVGIAVYGIVLIALKNEDIKLFIETFKTKFWKTKPLTEEQPDL